MLFTRRFFRNSLSKLLLLLLLLALLLLLSFALLCLLLKIYSLHWEMWGKFSEYVWPEYGGLSLGVLRLGPLVSAVSEAKGKVVTKAGEILNEINIIIQRHQLVTENITWTLSDILNRLLWSLDRSSLSIVDSVSSMMGDLKILKIKIIITDGI